MSTRQQARARRTPSGVLAVVLVLAMLALAGCAAFPDAGAREWREKLEPNAAGAPPAPPPGEPGGGGPGQPAPPPGPPEPPTGCVDPDPQVVATCLDPVSAVAVLPDGQAALVAERATGRVLRVQRDVETQVVATVPVDAAGGGLTGLVLSPGYRSDRLIYAYATTSIDNRVLRIAPNEPAEPVLSGIPRGPANNAGVLGVDRDGNLLVATGDAGTQPAPTSLAGKLLRIDTLGRPAPGNPDPASPIYSAGLHAPGGVCTERGSGTTWVTDRLPDRDVMHRATPGALAAPAWSWPDRPGVAGCVASRDVLAVAESGAAALFVLRPAAGGTFTGQPETMLAGTYGRLSPVALGPDGLVWLGTVNKGGGGTVVSSDDRVIRIQPPAGGGAKA